MSIKDFGKKIKPYYENKVEPVVSKIKGGLDVKQDIFIALIIILVGLAGFGLGKLSALEKGREPIEIHKAQFLPITATTTNIPNQNVLKSEVAIPMSAAAMIASENALGLLVASKSGQKYHFPWCAGASQIADKNKIWFASYEAAQKAGYTAASNCPNLK
jgi:hypothetical protein